MSDYTQTPNFSLYKPTTDADDGVWGTHWNLNADTLDAQLIKYALLNGATYTGPVVLAADPAAPMEAATQRWVEARIDAIGSPIVSADTPPPGADDNTLWWDSAALTLYYRYNDGNSSQWVSTNVGLSAQYLPLTGGTLTGPLYTTATGGTVARSEQDRAADVANVLDYGADPTGVADSSPAFQAALALRRNGRPVNVYAPAGNYYLRSPITVGDATYAQRIYGDGWSTVLTVGPDFSASAPGVILTNATSVNPAQPSVCDLCVSFLQPPDFTSTTTVDTALGGNNLTLASVSGILVGDYVMDLTNASTLPVFSEAPKVSGIAGNVVTMDRVSKAIVTAGHSIGFAKPRSAFKLLSATPTINPGDPGIQYPWAIYSLSRSVYIDHVLVTNAWNGVYIRGSTFTVGQLLVGCFAVGLDVDQCYNFPKIENYQLYSYGISGALQAVTYDGQLIAANIGRCDDFSCDTLQSWTGAVNITSAWSWGTINQLKMDGDQASLNIVGSANSTLHISALYSTKGSGTTTTPITHSGACRTSIGNINFSSAFPGAPALVVSAGSLSIRGGWFWQGQISAFGLISVTGGALALAQCRFDGGTGLVAAYLRQTGGVVRVTDSAFIVAPGTNGVAFSLADNASNCVVNVEQNGWLFTAPGPLGRYEVRGATSMTYNAPSSIFTGPDTVTNGQLQVRPDNGTLAAEGKLRFGGNFPTGADTATRLAASLRGGFSSTSWQATYLDLWLSSATNDIVSDANTTRVARYTLGGCTVGNATTAQNQTLDINGPAAFNRFLGFQTGGLQRWRLYADAAAESTGDAGSNFAISRYSDAGTNIGLVLTINRATGLVTISNGATISQINVTTTAGPNIRSGTGAATGTQPSGSLWLRTDGSAGARLYVSAGGGTWNAVAGV